jgi:23S rRNA pseudouridine1911/1915/1917 synthase
VPALDQWHIYLPQLPPQACAISHVNTRQTPPVTNSPRIPRTFRLIAENDDFVVVDKPPFLEAHPTGPNGRFTLWTGLRELLAFEIINGGQVSIINRLDRETSGLTLVAKKRAAARHLHGLMARRAIEKEYLAIAWGWPEADEFSVDVPLLRQGSRQPSRVYLKQCAHPDGAPARTQFRVERRFTRKQPGTGQFSLVRALPATGRTHQIRVHLAHCGHPIVGDKLYGPDEACYLEFIRTGWTSSLALRLLLPRHALHAAELRIPTCGLNWSSPLPSDLATWMAT